MYYKILLNFEDFFSTFQQHRNHPWLLVDWILPRTIACLASSNTSSPGENKLNTLSSVQPPCLCSWLRNFVFPFQGVPSPRTVKSVTVCLISKKLKSVALPRKADLVINVRARTGGQMRLWAWVCDSVANVKGNTSVCLQTTVLRNLLHSLSQLELRTSLDF